MTNYGYTPPTNPIEELRRFFRQRTTLPVLILINVAVWALIQAAGVVHFLLNSGGGNALNAILLRIFGLPAGLPSLEAHPWSLVTYMFLHTDLWHILFNMLWLYWFGKIFLSFLSSRDLLWIYLLGGISGGLLYILAFNTLPVFKPMVDISFALGASASVMAIVTAAAVYAPNYTVQLFLLGRLRILYLAGILFIFDFFLIPSGNAGGHLAHIGGALFGAAWVFVAGKGRTGAFRKLVDGWVAGISGLFRKGGSGSRQGERAGRPLTDEEYNLKKRETQRRIDEILDKISRGGYDSLSKEEKEFLFNTSHKR